MFGDRDEVALRLSALAESLERELGAAVEVQRDSGPPGESVWLLPARDDALAVGWTDFGAELHLQTGSGLGGRFELSRALADAAFVADVVRSVVAGRVVETFAAGRSHVVVTLADGRGAVETGYAAPAGCLPLPFWRRWGRTVRYAPYR